MLRAMVIDDDSDTRIYLRSLLEETELVEVIAEAQDTSTALQQLALFTLDVVFLDIHMEDTDSGITLAKKIRQFQSGTSIVFITAYRDYAVEAFEINSVDYIMKPFDGKRVRTAVLRIYDRLDKHKNLPNKPDRLCLKVGTDFLFVRLSDIYFIEKEGSKVHVHLRSDNGMEILGVYESLGELTERLTQSRQFLRSHKSYIINLHYVTKVSPWSNTSFQVTFTGYDKTALINRSSFELIKDEFGL